MTKLMIVGLLLAVLAGCNADIASPFDKPDETTQPVTCQGDGCAK
jgi:hypothetical protein